MIREGNFFDWKDRQNKVNNIKEAEREAIVCVSVILPRLKPCSYLQ